MDQTDSKSPRFKSWTTVAPAWRKRDESVSSKP